MGMHKSPPEVEFRTRVAYPDARDWWERGLLWWAVSNNYLVGDETRGYQGTWAWAQPPKMTPGSKLLQLLRRLR